MRDEFINHDDFFKGINNEDINLENEQSYSKQVTSESHLKDGKKITHTKTKVMNTDGTIHETEHEFIDDLKGNVEKKALLDKTYKEDKMIQEKKQE